MTLCCERADPHHLPCVVINSSGSDISGTLDSSYYKGQGERQGTEREYVCIRYGCRSSDSEVSGTGRNGIHGEQS